MHASSNLPSLRATVRLGGKGEDLFTQAPWWDVKFYPYATPGEDPVFAMVGAASTVICRCVSNEDNCIEILHWFRDERVEDEEGQCLNSIVWTRAENEDPIVCVAGSENSINVLNARTGEWVKTLVGHGLGINDLAISPADPTILVSCSFDKSVRIWSLDPAHAKQPTAAICSPVLQRKEGVLALGMHRKGDYVFSGGIDTRINLWRIPKFRKEELGTDKPRQIHYPYFSSSEIHSNFIDCIQWHNDLIISRASGECKILLWRIDNFNSDKEPPVSAPIPPSQTVQSQTPIVLPPKQRSGTLSAWGGRFQRLLQFELPESQNFYIRFNPFSMPNIAPILAAGNHISQVFFWDLQHLEEVGGIKELSYRAEPNKKKSRKNTAGDSSSKAQAPTLIARAHRIREDSVASSSTDTAAGWPVKAKRKDKTKREKRDGLVSTIGDSFRSLAAHKKITVPKVEFTIRQVSWSRDGKWCIACGDYGMIAIFSGGQGDGLEVAT
ncbi:WD40 repeat-like protein [Lojkania enalia]|uniref:WD40 repeat-like protein n=1 Tax=Lojkania enalia TaxID=147567 RepID=A0A9P4K4J8_9PLEO|nr:WD40 repeat-like protein [Didymosphaeria enalia]